MTLFEIIESIAQTSSTKEKQAIIEANKVNDCLKLAFLFAENPRFNFYIKDESPTIVAGANPKGRDIKISDFDFFLSLNERAVTGNDARSAFTEAIKDMAPGARVIMQRILNRDLRCGAGTSISNKVWKNLIPEYPVMLASKGDKKSMDYLEKVGGPYIVQKKCDGGRVNVVVDSLGNVAYHSRNGSTLELFGFFDSQFSRFKNRVFDGELLVRDDTGIVDRKTGNGLYTKAVRGTLSKQEVSKMCMEVWDVIPIQEFNAGIGTIPYEMRLAELLNIPFNPGIVQVVESARGNTLKECVTFYDKMRDEGEEGAIIKTAKSVWEDRRSKNMVKMKAEETADLLCISVEEGSGKYKGMIGNLVCITSCGKLITGVGTGLKDEDRARDQTDFIGKIIEVGYNEVISSKGKDSKSLFLPVYKQVRYDKNVANSLEELK